MAYSKKVKKILKDLSDKKISVKKALFDLKFTPFKDLGFAKVDCNRSLRRGFPEVVYCENKTIDQIKKISGHILKHEGILLLTRLSRSGFDALDGEIPGLNYCELGKIAYSFSKKVSKRKSGLVLVISAGTADIPVAEEARITLEVMGNRVATLYDVGVAGMHRIINSRILINKANVIIVVAGMEGALGSVVSSLVSKPVIAVPTSVGYGASFKGIAPLLTMLNSCSPGIVVVNIDNGFGAAYFANMINK